MGDLRGFFWVSILYTSFFGVLPGGGLGYFFEHFWAYEGSFWVVLHPPKLYYGLFSLTRPPPWYPRGTTHPSSYAGFYPLRTRALPCAFFLSHVVAVGPFIKGKGARDEYSLRGLSISFARTYRMFHKKRIPRRTKGLIRRVLKITVHACACLKPSTGIP